MEILVQKPKMELRTEKKASGWADRDGFVGPFQPGNGPRSDPQGPFPTGPEIGSRFPDVRTQTSTGEAFDLHSHRAGRPAIFVFFRSAVW